MSTHWLDDVAGEDIGMGLEAGVAIDPMSAWADEDDDLYGYTDDDEEEELAAALEDDAAYVDQVMAPHGYYGTADDDPWSSESDGAEVGFSSDADIDTLGAAIDTMTAEVNDVASRLRTSDDTDVSPKATAFQQLRWTPYVMNWKAWVSDHTGFFSRFDDAGFQTFKSNYGSLQAEWKKILASAQKTGVPDLPAVTEAPSIQAGTNPAGPTLVTPEGIAEQAPKYLLLAGGIALIVAAGYFGLLALPGIVAMRGARAARGAAA